MKSFSYFIAVVCGVIILTIPLKGHSITTLCIQSKEIQQIVRFNMTYHEIIETLGVPDVVKSDGMCLQYEYLGLSIFLSRNGRIERIYLANNFTGSIGERKPLGGIQLSDVENEFGARLSVEKRNYHPSSMIMNIAAVETGNHTGSGGQDNEPVPLSYPGNKKLYIFYHDGKIVKYKYVLDEEGIAFWLDHHQRIYATMLYPSRD